MKKPELRIWAKNIRKTLNMTLISNDICKNIRELDLYKKSKNIMIFYPLSSEVNLLPLIDDNKNFYLPCVKGDELLACPYKKGDELICSDLKIMEPKTAPINPNILDIIFTPALCVDKNYYRLGYGGGFYDRFFKNGKCNSGHGSCEATYSFKENGKLKPKSICVIPEELIIDQLPIEDYDIRCDGIVTQKKASF